MKGKNFLSDIKDFCFLLKPHFRYGKGYYTLSLVLNVLGEAGNSILWVYFYKTILNMVVGGAEFTVVLLTIAAFLIGVLLIDLLRNNPMAYLFPEWSVKIDAKISHMVLEKALECDYKNFDDPDFYHNYTLALQEYMQKSKSAFEFFCDTFSNIAIFCSMIVMIVDVSPWILLVNVGILFLTRGMNKIKNKYERKKWNEQNEISRKGRYIERTIYMREYAADLRCNRSKEYIVKKFDDKVADNISLVRRFKKITLGFRLYNLSAPHIIDFVAMGMAAYKITIGTLSVGDFTGTIQASKQLYWCMSPLINMANEINMYALYSQNLQKFFNTESVIESPKIRTGREVTPKTTDMPFAVEMKNVSFSYDNSNFALKNISMSIKPGQKIAIVGENGAGKSTLTKLLLRLYDTSSGDILINGQPIQDYDVHALRSDIGIAFQNTNLFAMTLAENMKLYREVSDEKLNEVVGKLGLSSVLKKFDCGLDAQVTKEFDKNGIVLSGGETQKLGLARLFTGQFGLLILDEPSAALDPIAEYELNKVIMELRDTTTIMISHRLSTVRDADCIYLIENGEIAEFGSHAELMKQGGKYAAMFNMQAEKYVESVVAK